MIRNEQCIPFPFHELLYIATCATLTMHRDAVQCNVTLLRRATISYLMRVVCATTISDLSISIADKLALVPWVGYIYFEVTDLINESQ
jgi:hypothetical protein